MKTVWLMCLHRALVKKKSLYSSQYFLSFSEANKFQLSASDMPLFVKFLSVFVTWFHGEQVLGSVFRVKADP